MSTAKKCSLDESFALTNFRSPLGFFFLLLLPLGLSGCSSSTEKSRNERIAINNRCLAVLENGAESDKEGKMLSEATEGFRKLAQEFPRERLGTQNLCITLLLRLKKTDGAESPAQFASLCKEFESASKALKKLAPDEPDADVFTSRFHQIKNERELAIESLRAACRTPKATVDTYFQRYQLLQMDAKPEHQAEMQETLRQKTGPAERDPTSDVVRRLPEQGQALGAPRSRHRFRL